MEAVSRRSFLVRGSAGVAGAATVAVGGIALTGGSAGAEDAPLQQHELAALDQPMLVRVSDAAAGEVEILVGEDEIVFTDRSLVARLLRASR